ncbi:non-claret disjunctional [Carabus blaptoides fortunei]
MPDAKGTDVYVINLTIQPIDSAEQLKSFMKLAQENRAVSATVNNERSSRSHSLIKIHLEAIHEELCTNSLQPVDLAGSELVNSSGTNLRINETKYINKSLGKFRKCNFSSGSKVGPHCLQELEIDAHIDALF